MTRSLGQRVFGEVAVEGSPCDSQDGGVGIAAEDPPWLAAYTRPRHEFKVKEYCEGRGIKTFLPCHKTWRRWSDRQKVLQLPLFPSYVFVRARQEQTGRLVTAPGLLWFVRNGNGPVEVDAAELSAVQTALGRGWALDPLAGVEAGAELEIACGALRGYRGCLDSKQKGGLILRVSAINATIRVRLPDSGWVAALPARRAATLAGCW